MRTRRGFVAVFAAAAFAAGAASAQTTPADPLAPGAASAQDAAPAAKEAKSKRAKRAAAPAGGALLVTVNNKRMVGLIALMVAPAGEEGAVKIAGPLAFGRKTTARVKRTKDCLYDIHGKFADEADTEQLGVDLCKDKTINLTDE